MATFGAECNGAPSGGMPHCFRLNDWLGAIPFPRGQLCRFGNFSGGN